MKSRGMMIIHNFRPGQVGGAELQAERLAAQLVKMGHEMQVLTQRTVPEALEEENMSGVQVHRTNYQLAYWISHGMEQTFRYLVKKRSSFDILHAHMAFGHAVVAVVIARCFRKKSIIKIACAGEFGDLAVFSKFAGFEKALSILQQAHAIVAVSSEVERELIEYGFAPEQIVRIPNGVDTTFFQRSLPFPKQEITKFILIGRRHPQKGIDTALHAAKILHDKGLDNQFEIDMYGADYTEYDYLKMAKELGITNIVKFLPNQKDIISVYQSAHCFLLPSRGEGLSNALLEAMSMGLPVIATSVSGTIDVVEDREDGILVPPDEPEKLANAMIEIIKGPDFAQSLGKNARQKVESAFSLKNIARQYADLYQCLK